MHRAIALRELVPGLRDSIKVRRIKCIYIYISGLVIDIGIVNASRYSAFPV